MKEYYTKTFFENQSSDSTTTARQVLPLVLKMTAVKSVADVGCGIGTWLSVFKELGVNDILGIDGEWVDKNMLLIPKENFINRDLTKPIQVDKKFDLVVSLEVAEHLDPSAAVTFVNSLVSLGSVILFSAAIPMQGGNHHVNEQWPEYWATLFKKHNYVLVDALRKKIWNDPKVGSWYAQNIFFFVQEDELKKNATLSKEYEQTDTAMLSLVHPRLFVEAMERHHELKKNYMTVRKLLFPVWWIGKLGKKMFKK